MTLCTITSRNSTGGNTRSTWITTLDGLDCESRDLWTQVSCLCCKLSKCLVNWRPVTSEEEDLFHKRREHAAKTRRKFWNWRYNPKTEGYFSEAWSDRRVTQQDWSNSQWFRMTSNQYWNSTYWLLVSAIRSRVAYSTFRRTRADSLWSCGLSTSTIDGTSITPSTDDLTLLLPMEPTGKSRLLIWTVATTLPSVLLLKDSTLHSLLNQARLRESTNRSKLIIYYCLWFIKIKYEMIKELAYRSECLFRELVAVFIFKDKMAYERMKGNTFIA